MKIKIYWKCMMLTACVVLMQYNVDALTRIGVKAGRLYSAVKIISRDSDFGAIHNMTGYTL